MHLIKFNGLRTSGFRFRVQIVQNLGLEFVVESLRSGVYGRDSWFWAFGSFSELQ